MARVTISAERWREWLTRALTGHVVFYPAAVENAVHWRRLKLDDLPTANPGPAWAFKQIRAAEPVKSFFFAPRETVATFPDKLEPPGAEPTVLLGAKACDLAALRANDRMFQEGEFADPFFTSRRRNTRIIAADCPEPAESCFCNLVGGRPHADQGADVTLSVIDGAFLLESLSPAGETLLTAGAQLSQPATEPHLAKREEQRAAAVKRLEQVNPHQWRADLPAAIDKRARDNAFWTHGAEECVECFGCLMGCPTCYCFLLYDRAAEAGIERTKTWDACYLAAFQRVGGGANPRGQFLTRFINRFQCKFQHFKNAHGFYACSGCGRCLTTCMGEIDIRGILGTV